MSSLVAGLLRVRCGSKQLFQRVILASPIQKRTDASFPVSPSCSFIANTFWRKSSE